jgi:ABC-type sugar transport system substrate-binding protein
MLIRPALAATLALAALTLGSTAAGTATAAAQSTASDWAGYAATGATYTSVSAGWDEPRLTCTQTDSSAAFWVGLDGMSSDTVEQAGTEAECVSGRAEYAAWYEFYPQIPVTLAGTVSAGDAMSVTVSSTAGDVFTVTVKDTTAGWSSTTKHTFTEAARSSAEVVAEVPTSGGVLPAASGSVTFTAAKVDGAALGAADPTEFNGTDISCGPLTGGTKFTCTWS